MADYIVRATAAEGQIRAFAATTKEMAETARKAHDCSPVATAALGRLLTAGAMMGVMMKGDKDVLTLQIKGEGPIGGLTVTADSHGNVKGYAEDPQVMLPANLAGKLDVGGAVGPGILYVIKDLGMKEPYVGQTELQTGEIAEDLTYYFAASEQVEKNNTVKQAGGFIIQLMPFTDEKVIEALEAKIAQVRPVTAMLDDGMTPEQILEELLGELGLEINETLPAQFHCGCSKERVSKALVSVGAKELQSMIDDGKEIEVNCHFCNTNYSFSVDELKELLKKSR